MSKLSPSCRAWMWCWTISTEKGLFNQFPETSPEAPVCILDLSYVLVSCLCGSLIEVLIALINGSWASSLRKGWKEAKKSEISFTESNYSILPSLKALHVPFYPVFVLSLKPLFRFDVVTRQFCHTSFPGLKHRAKWLVKMIHLQLWCRSQLCLQGNECFCVLLWFDSDPNP